MYIYICIHIHAGIYIYISVYIYNILCYIYRGYLTKYQKLTATVRSGTALQRMKCVWLVWMAGLSWCLDFFRGGVAGAVDRW